LLLALVVYAGAHQAHAASFTVSAANFAFSPSTLTVQVGDTVTWKNNDATIPHTTQSDGNWNSGNLAPGATFSFTFTTPGTYTYYCLYHRGMGMVGTIVVMGAAPSSTVTAAPSASPTVQPSATQTATAIAPTSTATPTATMTQTPALPTATSSPITATATHTAVVTASLTPAGTASPTQTVPLPTASATPLAATGTATVLPLAGGPRLPVQIHLAARAIDRGQVEHVQVLTQAHARLTLSVRFAGSSVVLHGTALANGYGLASFGFAIPIGPGAHRGTLAATLRLVARGAAGAQGSATARFTVYPPLRLRVVLYTTRVRGNSILWIRITTARPGAVRATVVLAYRNVQLAVVRGTSDGRHPLSLAASLGAIHNATATVVRVQVVTAGGASESLTKPYLVRA
jgi:plastocyanin